MAAASDYAISWCLMARRPPLVANSPPPLRFGATAGALRPPAVALFATMSTCCLRTKKSAFGPTFFCMLSFINVVDQSGGLATMKVVLRLWGKHNSLNFERRQYMASATGKGYDSVYNEPILFLTLKIQNLPRLRTARFRRKD